MAQRLLREGDDITDLMNQPSEISLTLRGQPSEIKEGQDVTDLMIEPEIPAVPREQESGLMRAWRGITKPIVDIPDVDPGLAEDYPTIAKIGQFGTDVLESLTSPLNVVTGGLFGGARALAGNLPRIARGMQTGGRVLSVPVAAEGVINLADPESTGAERFAGALELGGGILGMRAKLPKVGEGIKIKQGAELPIAEKPPLDLLPDDIKARLETPPDPNAPFPGDTIVKSPIDKLIDALGEAKKLTPEQAEIYRTERAERFARGKEIPIESEESFFKSRGQLAGEHTKVSMEPVKLEQVDTDNLFKQIGNAPVLYTDKIHAGDALRKILEGKVPQDNEIKILEKIFGTDSISAIRARLFKIDIKRNLVSDIVNIPRALQASLDLSFGGRQGLTLIHTKGWWNAWKDSVKSFGSDKTFRGIIDSIESRPNAQLIKRADGSLAPSIYDRMRLSLTDITEDIPKREEAFQSMLAERLPLGIGREIKASNRAYVAFGNKVRADNADVLYDRAKKIYETAKSTGKTGWFERGILPQKFTPQQVELLNPDTNDVLMKAMGDYINSASGRGRLEVNIPGKLQKYFGDKEKLNLEKAAVVLNTMLFSPRFIASRLQMMNPANYIMTDPFIRKQYLKSMASLSSYWLTMAGLAKMAGAEVSSDTNSADFGKIKIGNTRLDPPAGFQQYLVLLSRLGNGEYTVSTTGKSRVYGEDFGSQRKFDALVNFITNKLAPIPAYGARYLQSTKYRPFDVVDQSIRMFTPIILQDLSELAQEDPNLIPFIIPSAVGMGVQSYGERGIGNKVIPGLPEFNIR